MPGYTLDDGVTLKNMPGANSPQQLAHLERPLVASRAAEIAFGSGPSGNFSSAHFKAIHHHLFQDVF